MSAEQKPHDAQPWLCSHCREHVRIANDIAGLRLGGQIRILFYISKIMEIKRAVNDRNILAALKKLWLGLRPQERQRSRFLTPTRTLMIKIGRLTGFRNDTWSRCSSAEFLAQV